MQTPQLLETFCNQHTSMQPHCQEAHVSSGDLHLFSHTLLYPVMSLCEAPEQNTFTFATRAQRSKVTLTNWERLNNSPILLPRASAVQWNDHVFVLASDGTALLYHTKQGIWSNLPSRSNLPPHGPPPLTLHKGQVLTATQQGVLYCYNPQGYNWKHLQEPRLQNKIIQALAIDSHNSCLYLTVDALKKRESVQECSIVCFNADNKKVETCEVGRWNLKSTALVGDNLYVLTGNELYVKPLQKETSTAPLSGHTLSPCVKPSHTPTSLRRTLLTMGTESMLASIPSSAMVGTKTLKQVVKPPYTDCTLHAVKNTLFAFGGRDEDNQPTSDVLRYNCDTDSWENAGYMRTARYNVAVVTAQQDTYVVGGSFGSENLRMRSKLCVHVQQPVAGGVMFGRDVQQPVAGGVMFGGDVASTPQPSNDWSTCIIEKCSTD